MLAVLGAMGPRVMRRAGGYPVVNRAASQLFSSVSGSLDTSEYDASQLAMMEEMCILVDLSLIHI